MDKIDTLILDDAGIEYVHRYYKKIKHSDKFIPPMKQLVSIHMLHCDYCNTKSTHIDDFFSIQEFLNCGVQICRRCLQNHNHHVSFLENSLNKMTISWWQFIRLNYDNKFIRDLDPLKSIGIGFGTEKEPPFDYIYIDVTRVIKLEFTVGKYFDNLQFPIYFKFNKTNSDIFKKKNKYINLNELCNFDKNINKNIILERINKYLIF